MAKGIIEGMKIEISGSSWNEVTLKEYQDGRRIEHTYHAVTKKTVMKLLNSSKAPTIGDFDSWIKEENAQEKKERDKCVPSENGSDWWLCRD
jgi:hypothetical protein